MRLPLAFLVVTACGGVAPPDVDHSERFVGHWFVEETEAHALYGASTYEFTAEGTIALAWDAGFYGTPQGYVRSADDSVSCFFGDAWRSEGDDVLVIDGDCSDGAPREIELVFVTGPAANAVRASVEIVSVGGAPGWLPPRWGWSFQKCAFGEICTGAGPSPTP
jgi:hypothetical protein